MPAHTLPRNSRRRRLRLPTRFLSPTATRFARLHRLGSSASGNKPPAQAHVRRPFPTRPNHDDPLCLSLDPARATFRSSRSPRDLEALCLLGFQVGAEDPHHNKGLAFTEKERDAHYLRGLPPTEVSQDLQVRKMIHNIRQYQVSWQKYMAMTDLQVVAMVKCCTPNGLGDLAVVLKDPTNTIQASIHRRVLTEGDDGKQIVVGSILILQKVRVQGVHWSVYA